MKWNEVNFDGLVGPTHNFSGLSYGNLASTRNRNQVSFPRQAALQGLKKMRMLHDLGIVQAVLPPHLRPDLDLLRQCGFHGSNQEVIREASQTDPALMACASSSAFMWTANAATVSPAPDTADCKLHLTPANLISGLHRSREGAVTFRILDFLFSEADSLVHPVLPRAIAFADEGAANQMRMAPSHDQPAVEIFVYGRDALDENGKKPLDYPARQSLQASQAVARTHRLDSKRVLFWQQKSDAIDAGAFHNDVVAVANESVLFCHQDSFENQPQRLAELEHKYESLYSQMPVVIEVPRNRVSMEEAITTYLFNSQLVTRPDGSMALIAPAECEKSSRVHQFILEILSADNPIQDALFPDVRESMQNGGGPACLRLRILLNEQQLSALHQGVRFSPELETRLTHWVEDFYPERLVPQDLQDHQLYEKSWAALVALEKILGFPSGLLTDPVI